MKRLHEIVDRFRKYAAAPQITGAYLVQEYARYLSNKHNIDLNVLMKVFRDVYLLGKQEGASDKEAELTGGESSLQAPEWVDEMWPSDIE